MSETKNDVIEIKKNGVVEVNDQFTLRLSRTYEFEGEKISEIDVSVLPENSLHYALVMAADCTKYPIEFYKMLKPRDAIKVKNMVTTFFYGEE